MRRKLSALLILSLAAQPIAASAQDETVTVTAPKPREEIMRGFIRSYTTPSKVLGKIARWQDPICPITIGLDAEKNAAVSDRVRKIGALVGAPVPPNAACRTNVLIVFAPDPQELMKEIASHYNLARKVMGDIDGPMHARMISKITAPVQAWYGTDILDAKGNRIEADCVGCMIYTNGGIANGVSAPFRSVFIVVNLKKAVGYEVGTMADYVSMLVLSQTRTFDTCRELPSITNLLSSGCGDALKATALSDADLAYLRGVYKMATDGSINSARGDILTEMEKSAAGR